MKEEAFELLLADGRSGEPTLDQGMPQNTASHMQRLEQVDASHMLNTGKDPNLLPVQRWGVVAPEGAEGDRLLALVKELVDWRQECQGGAPVSIYRVPRSLGSVTDQDPYALWKSSVLNDPDRQKVSERPLYLLFLGDLDVLPFELQKTVAQERLVGRLAFSREQDYEAYVDKVLRWEKRPPPALQPSRALFYTVHDGTQATRIGYGSLMTPALEDLKESRREAAGLKEEELQRRIREVGNPRRFSIEELLSEAAQDVPTVLFSMSHGLGPPREGWRGPDEKREMQGAMSLGKGERLAAKELASRPFLPGGIWFYFACFGAGTPSTSAYWHWLKRLADAGQFRGELDSVLAALPGPRERPFIAALPQAALANPQGPLAVAGHVDLAWTYGFQDQLTGVSKRDRFTQILEQWLDGSRAGVGIGWLTGTEFGKVNTSLTDLYKQMETSQKLGISNPKNTALLAHLWMTQQDLAGYVLLGDPAVHLPRATAAAQPAAKRSAPPATLLAASEDEPQALEQAVLELCSRRQQLARELGIPAEELHECERLYQQAGLKALQGRKQT